MTTAKLIWATPDASHHLVFMARVSSPKNQVEGLRELELIKYLLGWRKGKMTFEAPHWSPFEMVYAAIEINTTRDIGRQILRHRSFSFQEFSQRYADASLFDNCSWREARLQDHTNRQNSLETDDKDLGAWWVGAQMRVHEEAEGIYQEALKRGIAKEVARAILPEGLTPTRMYMCGSFRSWIHYLAVRTGQETQKEHREVAQAIERVLTHHEPMLMNAAIQMREQHRGLIKRALDAQAQAGI